MKPKNLYNAILFYFLFIVFYNQSFSQTYLEKFNLLDVEHGLSQSTVYAITQDSAGFMWFGTQDGLNKYDGYSFTVYKHDRFDSLSISNNFVTSLFIDSKGNIWAGTSGGLNLLLPDQKYFKRYVSNPSIKNSLSDNVINAIAEDSAGYLWIGTQNGGINRLNVATGEISVYKNVPSDSLSLSGNCVRTLFVDGKNNLWIGTDGKGLNLFDRKSNSFVTYKFNPLNSKSLSFNSVFQIEALDKDRLLVASFGGGINILDTRTGEFDHSLIHPEDRDAIKLRNSVPLAMVHPRSLVTTTTLSKEGTLWYGTISDGLYKIDLKNNSSKSFREVRGDEHGLAFNGIRSLFYSKDGILWIGTNGSGINTYSLNSKKFNTILPRIENAGTLSFSSIRSIYEDESGRLYIGGYSGLNIIDRKTGKVEDPFGTRYVVYVIREDPDNPERYLLFGTEGGGLLRYDKVTGTLSQFNISYKREGITFTVYSVYAILAEKGGTYLLGTESGLVEYDANSKNSVFYITDAANPKSVNPGRLRAILKDSFGETWVGTDIGGISKFDRETKKFTRYTHRINDLNSLSNNRINTFFEDSKKRLWVGTATGLNLYNRENNSFTVITEKEGLPNNVVYAILEDDSGNLWLSTNKGLCCFNYEYMSFSNYDYIDGLSENEFNSSAYFKNRKGELFFGSLKGVTYFHPPEIGHNPYVPPLVFTKFSLFNKEVILDPHISKRERVELSYSDNLIAFEFSALNYDQSAKNRYSYTLEGFSDGWIDLGTKREITFTNLDPGTYVLKVKGSNNDGIWNEEGIQLKIIINPPFWATLWFRILLVLFVLSVILGGIQIRIRTVEKQKEILEQVVKERTSKLEESRIQLKEANETKDKFFSIIAHDLRNPFQTLLGFSEILLEDFDALSDEEKLDLIGEISHSSHNAHKLLNNLLQWSRSQTGTIPFSPENINLRELFETELLVLKTFAIKKNICINFFPNPAATVFADRDMMATVFRNLVSNAIKFTKPDGEVTITMTERNGRVVVCVIDNGLGMSDEKRESIFNLDAGHSTAGTNGEQGTGLGLILCKEFVEKNNGKIWVESKLGEGSSFCFSVPKEKKD